jgi:collagen type III alpha
MIAIAELEFLHELAIMSGQAAPPGPQDALSGGGGGGGFGAPIPAPAAPAGGGAAPAMPGNSLPEMGIGVGTQGGRPPGGGAAPQAMAAIGGPRTTGRGL